MIENIIFDCEKMRHPHTGLFTFCDELAKALVQEKDCTYNLGFFVPKEYKDRFGEAYTYIIRKSYYKYFFRNSHIGLWHSSNQLTHYMPSHTKCIQTIHDLNFLHEKVSNYKRNEYMRRIDKHLKRQSQIIAISEFTKQDLLNNFNITPPLNVIYNGCDVYTGEIKEPVDVPKRPFLYTISTILPKKNFHVLPCLLHNNDYELIISGLFYSTDYVNEILKEAKEWHVEDRVHLTGPVSEAEKHWYLKHCDAFVFPSIAEGFGLPVLEAMQYGKPIFLSDYTSLPEIGKNHAYYFNHDFIRSEMQREFIQGLEDFNKDENKPEIIRQYALSYSWKNAARQYWEIYKKVLTGNG